MKSEAASGQAGIGQFFDPAVVLDKLRQEFDRLDVQWNTTLGPDGKLVPNKLILSEENYMVDLTKARQVIDVLVDVLEPHFEFPLFKIEGANVVQSHPVIQQMRALSTSLLLVKRSKLSKEFPYHMTIQGNKLNCSHRLHLRYVIGLVDLIKKDTNIAREYQNRQEGRKLYPDCTLLEACEILCDNVEVWFKGSPVKPRKLKALYYSHHQ